MSNLALYQIAEQFLIKLNALENSDLTDEQYQIELDQLQGEVTFKSHAVAMYIKNLQALADARKNAEQEMYASRKKIDSAIERLKSYQCQAMLKTGITKMDFPEFTISVRTNPPSVEILNMDSIPDEYFDIPPPPAPQLNKTRLKDDMKVGVIIEGVRLTQSHRLDIK
jgi:hypothetical protein